MSLQLAELTINGFKSFAKKSELEFSAPITAIVGPNGSGKSNVAEAFRFVLGEQSVKSLRGKKGEDLIWGGSEKVSRANRATVRVLLNNENRVFPVDFDHVEVERTVHRDGQNEYRMNGSKVRLKDVQEVLAAANIGSTGHHIISQGEADRVLSAGAKERREMIEDALGLKVYQYKKQEAQKKLEKTRANITQVEQLRREAAPHLQYLERQIKKIEKSLALQEELKSLYAEYLKREDVYIAAHSDRLKRERQAPASRLEQVKEALAAAKETLEKTKYSTNQKALTELEAAVKAATSARQEALRAVSQVEGQVTFLERRLKERSVVPKAEAAMVPYSALEKVVEQVEGDIEKALNQHEPAALSRALSGVVRTLRLFLQKHEGVVPEVASTVDDEAELAALRDKLTQLYQTLEGAEAAENKAQQAYEALQQEIDSEQNENREAERRVFELVNEQRELQLKLEQLDRELQILERDRAEFKRELQEAVTLIGRAASQYFAHEVYENGEVVSQSAIAAEERSVQRERQRELEKRKIRLEELGIGATEEVTKEYNEAKERDAFLEREIADLNESVTKLEALIAELDGQLQTQFNSGIDKISVEFQKFFALMFGGGTATLKVVLEKKRDEEDDELEAEAPERVETGVELEVALPNKRVKGLQMLSGGERALTSIALIFAMSQVNPPLFIILDETDAALDEANSRRYGDMIEALAKKSQLILITHNRETMSRAGILYGVTMAGDGVSKLLSVKFDEAAAVAK